MNEPAGLRKRKDRGIGLSCHSNSRFDERQQVGVDLICVFVEDLNRRSARVLVRLHHDRWDGTDQDSLRDPAFAVSSHITGNLSTSCRMAELNGVTKIELFYQLVHVGAYVFISFPVTVWVERPCPRRS